MQRSFRLTRSEDFKRVRRDGTSYAHPLVVLIVQNKEHGGLRVGVTAGKSVGTAVDRNRAKRLLREAMRTLLPDLASHADLILIARSRLVSTSLPDARNAVLNVLKRAKLFTPTHES